MRLNRISVDERAVRAVITFVLIYVGLVLGDSIALLADAHRTGLDSPHSARSRPPRAHWAIGPGLRLRRADGLVRPPFSDLSKSIMIALMWVGRSEIIPVVALFTRAYWRA